MPTKYFNDIFYEYNQNIIWNLQNIIILELFDPYFYVFKSYALLFYVI